MKNFPIWLAKLLLVAAGLLYWEVPQWIIHSSDHDPRYKDLAIGYKAIGQFRIPENENERYRMLEDSLQKDIAGVNIETITFDIYFQILWKHDERSKRFGFQGMTTGFTWTNFQAKSDRYLRVGDDWPSKLETARDKYRDIYEPGWREKEKQSAKEFNDFVAHSPLLLLKIYWFNIFFALIWFMVLYVSKKREANEWRKPIPLFNPISIGLSALIWPYFFFRSFLRGWLGAYAEAELRATKVNPFSLLSHDERTLIKKFARSMKTERVEILTSIKTKSRKHSVSFALCATLCVRILPLYATCLPVIETVGIEHSILTAHTTDTQTIDHDVGWNEECEITDLTPWKSPALIAQEILFFIFLRKCLKGIKRELDHVPDCTLYFNLTINLKSYIKKYLYEKSKNHGSALPSWIIILRTGQSRATQISLCWHLG